MAAAPALRHQAVVFGLMVAAFVVGPFVVYPVFLMKALCFALFACAVGGVTTWLMTLQHDPAPVASRVRFCGRDVLRPMREPGTRQFGLAVK